MWDWPSWWQTGPWRIIMEGVELASIVLFNMPGKRVLPRAKSHSQSPGGWRGAQIVAKHEEENPEFADFSMPTGEPAFADLTEGEPAGQSGIEFETAEAGEPEVDTVEVAEADLETEQPVEEEFPEEADEEGLSEEFDEEEEPAKRSWWMVLVECLCVAAFMAGVYFLMDTYTPPPISIWNTAYAILMALVPYVLFKTRRWWTTPEISAPYTVIAALTFAAITTGVYYLGLELVSYDKDWKAEKGKQIRQQWSEPFKIPPVAKPTDAKTKSDEPEKPAGEKDAKPAPGPEAKSGDGPAEKPPVGAGEKPDPGAGEKPPAAKE
jgi:hypothetical protein